MKLLFLFFLLPLQIFAQNIAGVWTGTLFNDTTKQFIKYEVAISEYKGKLSGYSHTIFLIDRTENIGVKSIKIKRSGKHFFVEDDKLIYNNYTSPPAKGVKTYSELMLSQNDSAMVLSGPWNTNQTKIYQKLTGNIFLQKKKEIKKTLIIPKLENLGLAKSLSFMTSSTLQKDLAVLNKSGFIPAQLNDQAVVDSGNMVFDKKKKVNSQSDQFNIKGETSQQTTKEASKSTPDKSISKKITSPVVISSPKNETVNMVSPKSQNNKIDKPGNTDVKIVSEVPKAEENSIKNKVINDKSPTTEMPVQKNVVVNDVSVKSEIQPLEKQKITPKKITGVVLNNINTLKVIPQAAAEIATRKIETVRSVEIKQDSLLLSLYDNGEIDGDTVSVLLNGNVIMPMQGLTARGISKTIYFTPEMGDSMVLVMYAENLGSIPPNTGLLVIHDGEDIFEIRFAGDLRKNSAIILKRKKKQ